MASSQAQPCVSSEAAGVILAGGQSRRMGGADKAFLTVDGRPVVERTLALLGQCFPQVVVVSNQPDKYVRFGVQVVRDEFPGKGPLAGIHAAMRHIHLPYAFVVACDMPFLRIEPIRFLVERAHGQEAIIASWDGDIEPLHALYASRLQERIGVALQRGTTAIRDFLREVDAEYVPEPVMRGVLGAEESFRNINTPEEAARFAVQLGVSRSQVIDGNSEAQ